MGFDVYSATGELQTLLPEQQWALDHWACSQPKGCSYHPHMSLEMFSSTELLGLVTYPGFGTVAWSACPAKGRKDAQGLGSVIYRGQRLGKEMVEFKTSMGCMVRPLSINRK